MSRVVSLIRPPQGAVRLVGHKSNLTDLSVPRKDGKGVWHSIGDGIEKLWVDKTGRRMIEGIASTGTTSSNGQSLNPRGCIAHLPVPLLFGHGFKKGTRQLAYKNVEDAKVGDVVMLHKTASHITVRAVIDDSFAGDAAWELIESGEARCFSVGPERKSDAIKRSGIVDGVHFFDQWELREVSVCFKGANPDCTFDIVKVP